MSNLTEQLSDTKTCSTCKHWIDNNCNNLSSVYGTMKVGPKFSCELHAESTIPHKIARYWAVKVEVISGMRVWRYYKGSRNSRAIDTARKKTDVMRVIECFEITKSEFERASSEQEVMFKCMKRVN